MCHETCCPLTLSCLLSHFSHVQLFAMPWIIAHQAPQFMGFSRQEYWSGFPCPPCPLTHTPKFKKCQPLEVFFSRKGRHKLILARLFIYHSWSFRRPSSCYGIYFPFSCDKILYRLWIPFSFHPCLSVMSARVMCLKILISDLFAYPDFSVLLLCLVKHHHYIQAYWTILIYYLKLDRIGQEKL